MNRSRASLEKRTLLSTLSRDFPFDHFFFFPLPPAMAAAIFCSFDFCWTLGGMVTYFYLIIQKKMNKEVNV